MATEQDRAALSLERGRQAAKMPHEQAKKYIAGSANIDKDYESIAQATSVTRNKQMTSDILGSMKQGGTVPKTGNYKLHKGETVVPQESTGLFKKPSDPPFAGVVRQSKSDPDPDKTLNAPRNGEPSWGANKGRTNKDLQESAARFTADQAMTHQPVYTRQSKHMDVPGGSNGPHAQYQRNRNQNRDGR